jgi:hypothetical protein
VKYLLLLAALLLPMARAQDAQHVYDGHVVERLQSITITPKAGAPFRATIVTDWTRTLADGTRVTMKNHRTVARDSTGRIFQERRFFAPDGDVATTRITELDYYDPVRKEVSVCEPARRLCTVHEWPQTESAVETCKPFERPNMTVTCDALGAGNTGNLQTVGSRQIVTVTGGPMGYKEPEPTIKEFWFSPRLDLNLVVKRFEPRGGAQNFTFTNIDLNEPDAHLFTLPEGFRTARTVIQ